METRTFSSQGLHKIHYFMKYKTFQQFTFNNSEKFRLQKLSVFTQTEDKINVTFSNGQHYFVNS